jgi:cytochrome P450
LKYLFLFYFIRLTNIEKKTLKEIEFNLVGFLLAGFETTSTALGYCFYVLATKNNEMLKLQDEIDLYFLNSHVIYIILMNENLIISDHFFI